MVFDMVSCKTSLGVRRISPFLRMYVCVYQCMYVYLLTVSLRLQNYTSQVLGKHRTKKEKRKIEIVIYSFLTLLPGTQLFPIE